jgi:hypothetical protein
MAYLTGALPLARAAAVVGNPFNTVCLFTPEIQRDSRGERRILQGGLCTAEMQC